MRRLRFGTTAVQNGNPKVFDIHHGFFITLYRLAMGVGITILSAMALRGYTISNHSDQHDRDIQTLFKYHEDVLASLKSLTEGTVTWREEDAYRQDQEKRMNEALADIQRNLQYLRNGQTYNRNVLEGWRRPLEDH